MEEELAGLEELAGSFWGVEGGGLGTWVDGMVGEGVAWAV